MQSTGSQTLVNTPAGPIEFLELEDRSPVEQMEALNEILAVQNRIREGARNLLTMDLSDGLREQVISELDMAQSKIDAIKQRIELLVATV